MPTLNMKIGGLSKDSFQGHTSTGSEPFSLFICLDANKFVAKFLFSYEEELSESFKQTTDQ